jgi:hypothetical protein
MATEQMGETLYRAVDRDGPVRPEGGIPADAKVCHVRACMPQDADTPVGEWGCTASLCPVMGVAVRLQAANGCFPSMLKCPACGGPMEFRHWVGVEVLLPVAVKAG